MRIYVGFDDTDTSESDRGTGNWLAGLKRNCLIPADYGCRSSTTFTGRFYPLYVS